MSFALVWSYVAEHVDIQRIPRHSAEKLDAAVMRFAATGLGGEVMQPTSLGR